MRKIWAPVLGWVAAIGAAVALASYAPHEAGVLGKVPTVSVKRLDQTPMVLPQQLPSGRTLALVIFKRSQREEIQSWIDGLGLQHDTAIVWVKLPVMNDPGDEKERRGIEQRMLDRHPDQVDRARLVPLFTDREAFVRAAGLTNTDHASVLVLDRDGNVLARAEGAFDQQKGQALRETILAQND